MHKNERQWKVKSSVAILTFLKLNPYLMYNLGVVRLDEWT